MRPLRESELLTSGEAAATLGVAPATLKRWADGGRLRCVRTAGGHRRFPAEEVERLRSRLAGGADPLARWVDRLLSDRDRALAAALRLERERLGTWWQVADALGPVIHDLGRRWEEGEVCVLDEHAASERLTRVLARCCEELLVKEAAPRLLLATAEGDDHTLGLSLVELSARERGWRALWAGRATPASEIVRAVRGGEVDAVALSASTFSRAATLERELEEVGAACDRHGAALVVGGAGPWPAPGGNVRLERDFAGFDRWMREQERARRDVRRG